MGLVRTTDAASEPVTVAEAKEYLRVDSGDSSQDTTLATLIAAARRQVEEYLRIALISQTWTWEMDADDMVSPILIPRPQVQSITTLKTYDDDYNLDTVTSTNYALHGGQFLVADNDGWEINHKEKAGQLIYVTGTYTDETDTPDEIKLAILRIVANNYEAREDVAVGTVIGQNNRDWKELVADHVYNGF